MLRDLLRTRPGRIAAVSTLAVAAATAISMAILWPTGESDAKLAPTLSQRTELAQVVTVKDVECSAPGLRNCRRVRVALKSGGDDGRSFDLDEGGGPSPLPLNAGDRLRVARNAQTEGAPELQPYAIADFDRRSPMLWLLITFVVIVAVLGRRHGIGRTRRLTRRRDPVRGTGDPRRPPAAGRRARGRTGGDARHDHAGAR